MGVNNKLLLGIIVGVISGIGLSSALNVTQTLDNTVAYIKKMIWTNDGTDLGAKKVVIDGGNGSITMAGALNIKKGALKDDTVESNDLVDGAIGTTQLADNAVTSSKIAANAITSDMIATGSITSSKLDPSAHDGGTIDNGSISSDKLADDISVKNLTVMNSLDANGIRVNHVGIPTDNDDAASKSYVDAKVGAAEAGSATSSSSPFYAAISLSGTRRSASIPDVYCTLEAGDGIMAVHYVFTGGHFYSSIGLGGVNFYKWCYYTSDDGGSSYYRFYTTTDRSCDQRTSAKWYGSTFVLKCWPATKY